MLTREEILSADDLKTEAVPVPEWGDGAEVLVSVLDGERREYFERMAQERKDSKVSAEDHFRATLLASVLVDESGNRLFSDEDIPALNKKSSVVLDRLFTVAQRVNCSRKEDIEELAKNYGRAPSESSGTD